MRELLRSPRARVAALVALVGLGASSAYALGLVFTQNSAGVPGNGRFTTAGAPAASIPAGIVAPAATTEPAATRLRAPIVAPSSTIEPLATRHSSSSSAPCTTQLCATVAPGPMSVVSPGGPWITAFSWMFAPARTTTGA